MGEILFWVNAVLCNLTNNSLFYVYYDAKQIKKHLLLLIQILFDNKLWIFYSILQLLWLVQLKTAGVNGRIGLDVPNHVITVELEILCRKFLTKILIFDQNFDFWPISSFLTKIILRFLPNLGPMFLTTTYDFWPKCRFLTNISIFEYIFYFNENVPFWSQIWIFDQNNEINVVFWPNCTAAIFRGVLPGVIKIILNSGLRCTISISRMYWNMYR